MEEFTPPIKVRSTAELLEIVGATEKWNPKAVRQASHELKIRNISPVKIDQAKYLETKKYKLVELKKAKESYHICDFILRPIPTLLGIIFIWEYKKDGYLKKARQQRIFRIILLIFIILIIATSSF